MASGERRHASPVARLRPLPTRGQHPASLWTIEMIGSLLYPRLGRAAARGIFASRADASLVELSGLAALDHADAAPSATGGRPADHKKLIEIQSLVRGLAEDAGFPEPI